MSDFIKKSSYSISNILFRFSFGYTKIPSGSIDKNGRNISGELAIEELREAVRKVLVTAST